MNFIKKKKKAVIISVILILGVSFYFYKANGSAAPTRYIVGTPQTQTLVVSVSGSGQVSASNQVDIKPNITANVVSILKKQGDKVKAGDVIAQLDDANLKIQADQAENSVEIAKDNLNLKLAGPTKENIAVSQKSVDSAQVAYNTSLTNLQNAKDSANENLQKAQLGLSNAQVSLDNAQQQYDSALASQDTSSTSSSQTLTNAYDNAKSTINSAMLNFQPSLQLGEDILGSDGLSSKYTFGVSNQVVSDAQNSYYAAKNSYNNFINKYNSVSQNWNPSDEDALLTQTIDTANDLKALEQNLYNLLANVVATAEVPQTTIDTEKQSVSGEETSLLSSISSVQTSIQTINNDQLGITTSGNSSSSSVDSAKASLDTAQNNFSLADNALAQAKLSNEQSINTAQADVNSKKIALGTAQAQYNLEVAKPRPVDIAALEAQVQQAENSYEVALQNLKDAQIVSPIGGTVAQVDLNVGDSASPSTAVATVVTPEQIADVSLNEVDAAKVKSGQQATLTFNAIDGLSISGVVTEVDTIGTVTQGVVDYNAKIAFDTQNNQIKPGMSATASIIVNEKQNVLTVPNSAVKSDGNNGNYVEVLTGIDPNQTNAANGVTAKNPPEQVPVTIGLQNDTDTEIVQGLQPTDEVVSRTVTSGATQTSTQSGSRSFGGGGGGRIFMMGHGG